VEGFGESADPLDWNRNHELLTWHGYIASRVRPSGEFITA
jgi:hypothetical protein